ncbi:uncharacterized protein LOC130676879 [Microplitis mediator]|uniref:uncharacterized protein LOC130676879 n=1 Tax=Microplitis mediator TaxID=375433 RepID=UPI0025579109|nr:uncharacterized protein LOC130676879 [Microplitis mediator]
MCDPMRRLERKLWREGSSSRRVGIPAMKRATREVSNQSTANFGSNKCLVKAKEAKMERASRSPEVKERGAKQSLSSSSSSSSSSTSSSSSPESQVTSTSDSPRSGRFKESHSSPKPALDMPFVDDEEEGMSSHRANDIEEIMLISTSSEDEEKSRATPSKTTLIIKEPAADDRKLTINHGTMKHAAIVIKATQDREQQSSNIEPPFSKVTRPKFKKHPQVKLTEMSRAQREAFDKKPTTDTQIEAIDMVAKGGGEITTGEDQVLAKIVTRSTTRKQTSEKLARLKLSR